MILPFGIDGAEWGHLTEEDLVLLKQTFNADSLCMHLFLDWWRDDIAHPNFPVTYRQKLVQIGDWCQQQDVNLIIKTFGTTWNPLEGWVTMKRNAVDNVNGLKDYWISTYGEMVSQLHPYAIYAMNEPPDFGASYLLPYKSFVQDCIDAWRTLKPDLNIIVQGMPFWYLQPMIQPPVINDGQTIYSVHYYYMYDNSDPHNLPYYDAARVAYWEGRLDDAKTALYNHFDSTLGIVNAQMAGLQIMFGESGGHQLNPNIEQYYRDFYEYVNMRNLGVLAHIYYPYYPSRQGLGLLNTDWHTLTPFAEWRGALQSGYAPEPPPPTPPPTP